MSISRSTLMTQIETYTLNRGSATILQRFFPKVLSLNHARGIARDFIPSHLHSMGHHQDNMALGRGTNPASEVLIPKAMDPASRVGGNPFLSTSSPPTDYESRWDLFPSF